jgi:hypothetical protein
MNIKIKGWEKISGFTYKGFSIVNPIHNAYETKYMADVLDLNQSHKPKWELNVLGPGHKWKAVTDTNFHILLWDEDKFSARREVSKDMISSVSSFRQIFETLVDEVLDVRRKNSLFTNVSKRVNGGTGSIGIVNAVNNSGTLSIYDSSTGASIDLLDTIKTLQKQIEDLKSQQNGIK